MKLMHEMGLDAYRFSISWSRLIPGNYVDGFFTFRVIAEICIRNLSMMLHGPLLLQTGEDLSIQKAYGTTTI